jgi:hypothetical protein
MRLNRMVPPEQIRASDSKAVFLEDSAGDWRFSFDIEDPNMVYEGELDEEWETSAERLPEVLMHSVLLEATSTGKFRSFGSQVEERYLPDILAPMTEVGLSGWRWYDNPYCRIFMTEKMVAVVEPVINLRYPRFNIPGRADVQVAANDLEHLMHLESIPGIKWQKNHS